MFHAWLAVYHLALQYFDKMYKQKISNYFCGKRNEEKDKNQEKDQDKLNVEEMMVVLILRWGKHLTKAAIFRQNEWKNTHG